LVLQSSTNSLHILPGSSSESHASSSDGVCNFSNTEVEEGVDVIEESFIAVSEEADIGIKQEEIPEDVTFSDIKSEPDEVSYVGVCLSLDIFYHCPALSLYLFEKAPPFGIKMFCCDFLWRRGVFGVVWDGLY